MRNPNIGSRNLIWALGFRNPQGISFHPWTGDVFISEHGPGNDDEVTKLTAGANGGWTPNTGGQYNGVSVIRAPLYASRRMAGVPASLWPAVRIESSRRFAG